MTIEGAISPTSLMQGVRILFTERGYEPPMFPSVALELHALTRRSDVSFLDVRTLLESDPLLATRVLKLTRSPTFAGRVYVATLHDAIVRLGLDTMSQIFMEVAVTSRVFRAPSPQYAQAMDDLRVHSVLSAHASRALCHALGLPDNSAFLCGLLHDIGCAIGLVALSTPRLFQQTPPYAEVAGPLHAAREAIGGFVARAWALPPDVVDVVSKPADVPVSLLDRVVSSASSLAEAIVAHDTRPAALACDLGIEDEKLDEIWTLLQPLKPG